jgi:hypothetical protein
MNRYRVDCPHCEVGLAFSSDAQNDLLWECSSCGNTFVAAPNDKESPGETDFPTSVDGLKPSTTPPVSSASYGKASIATVVMTLISACFLAVPIVIGANRQPIGKNESLANNSTKRATTAQTLPKKVEPRRSDHTNLEVPLEITAPETIAPSIQKTQTSPFKDRGIPPNAIPPSTKIPPRPEVPPFEPLSPDKIVPKFQQSRPASNTPKVDSLPFGAPSNFGSFEGRLERFKGPSGVRIYVEEADQLKPQIVAQELCQALQVTNHAMSASGGKITIGLQCSGTLEEVVKQIKFGEVLEIDETERIIRVRGTVP